MSWIELFRGVNMIKDITNQKVAHEKTETYYAYLRILNEELIPAMGCTEPIALAYAAAKARCVLGEIPDKIDVCVSGDIIKNVKSVVVPNTNGLKGIKAAVAAGIISAREDRVLEVLADMTPNEKLQIRKYLENTVINVSPSHSSLNFDINLTLYKGNSYTKLRITEDHTNVVLIEKNGDILYQPGKINSHAEHNNDKQLLDINNIFKFANVVEINDIKNIISRQIRYNMNIAEEGLKNNYGANIGKVLLSMYGNDIKIRAKAKAAAASDARMNGCELPVIIVSGSGNQGIAASVPVIEYATEYHIDSDTLYRALVLSNLIAIYLKTGIGCLSAFCGAVCAGCASGAAIAYLLGGDLNAVSNTISNSLAIVSGIICDGAKSSCASKIASSVEAGILGYHMYLNEHDFLPGDGIVGNNMENTVNNIWRLAKIGMKETDVEILNIMTEN